MQSGRNGVSRGHTSAHRRATSCICVDRECGLIHRGSSAFAPSKRNQSIDSRLRTNASEASRGLLCSVRFVIRIALRMPFPACLLCVRASESGIQASAVLLLVSLLLRCARRCRRFRVPSQLRFRCRCVTVSLCVTCCVRGDRDGHASQQRQTTRQLTRIAQLAAALHAQNEHQG